MSTLNVPARAEPADAELGKLAEEIQAALPHWAIGPKPMHQLAGGVSTYNSMFAPNSSDNRTGWAWTTRRGHWTVGVGSPMDYGQRAVTVQGPGGYWLFDEEDPAADALRFLRGIRAIPALPSGLTSLVLETQDRATARCCESPADCDRRCGEAGTT